MPARDLFAISAIDCVGVYIDEKKRIAFECGDFFCVRNLSSRDALIRQWDLLQSGRYQSFILIIMKFAVTVNIGAATATKTIFPSSKYVG